MVTAATKPHEHELHLETLLVGDEERKADFALPSNAALLEVLQEGAERTATALLPDPAQPLDRLHDFLTHRELVPAIDDLSQPVGPYLQQPHTTHTFGIELVRAFRVNTRWAVAPEPALTPRQILALPAINLDFQSYTLYRPGSTEPLPLDVPVAIQRGEAFEAQRDGRYGAGTNDVSAGH